MREQILKKSELNIKNMYDYGRITRHHEQLIPCSLQEKDEDIIFQFDISTFVKMSLSRIIPVIIANGT